jgi:hypothetical protein
MCRAEMQVVGEQALQGLRIANDVLEPLAPEPSKQPKRMSRRKTQRGDDSPPMPAVPLDTARQPSYDDEEAPDGSSRNAFSDGISGSQGMRKAEDRYAAIAEDSSSSSGDADASHETQNGSSPDYAEQSARSTRASSSRIAISERSKHGIAKSSAAKVTLKVMHDVAAAVQPGSNSSTGSRKNGGASLNGTGQGLEPQPEPSSVPSRVAVEHKSSEKSDQDDTASQSGNTSPEKPLDSIFYIVSCQPSSNIWRPGACHIACLDDTQPSER